MSELLVKQTQVKSVMTKSNLPVGGYSVNPYVGCTHACKYCYASFMKRFTGHEEPWGTFLDVKYWAPIQNPRKYAGERVVIGSVTDGYLPEEQTYRRTRALLEQLVDSDAKIMVCTKSDLVVRDLDLLTRMKDVTVSWSVNTLDEDFRAAMDCAAPIERRLAAMKEVYDAGLRTVCFTAPIFPGITDVPAILHRVRDRCDFVWLENLNLRGGFKGDILAYIAEKRPALVPLYDAIYKKRDRGYWQQLEREVRALTEREGLPYLDNYLPDGRSKPHHPAVVNYFYHEQVRGSENTGARQNNRRKKPLE